MVWLRSDSDNTGARSSKGGKPVRELGAESYGMRNREQTRLAVTRKKQKKRRKGMERGTRIRYDSDVTSTAHISQDVLSFAFRSCHPFPPLLLQPCPPCLPFILTPLRLVNLPPHLVRRGGMFALSQVLISNQKGEQFSTLALSYR